MGKSSKAGSKLPKKEPHGKDDKMSLVYRQFSREKYNKYKRQFPRMRQSQIVSKIIKQWQALSQTAKQDYLKKYTERSGEAFFKSGSSSLSKSKSKDKRKKQSGSKSKSKSSKEKNKKAFLSKSAGASKSFSRSKQSKMKRPKKPSPQTRVYQEKKKSPKRSTSDFKRSGSKSKPYDTSSDPSGLVEKMKVFKKGGGTRNSAYLQFFKYYYERLTSEHSRWNSTQITTIIKLLWKKRTKQRGKQVRRSKGKIIQKTISGWQYYRKIKENEGLTRPVIKQMWRALPIQSKRFYKIKGEGKSSRPKRTSGVFVRKVLNSGITRMQQIKSDGIMQRDYSWMQNQMI